MYLATIARSSAYISVSRLELASQIWNAGPLLIECIFYFPIPILSLFPFLRYSVVPLCLLALS